MMTSTKGYTSPGEGLPPHLANEDMQFNFPQEDGFVGSCILRQTGYKVISLDYGNAVGNKQVSSK